MKPGRYTQLYIQLVFAPKYRESLLSKRFRNEICYYSAG